MFEILINPVAWLIISGMAFSVLAKKLTLFASITGGILALIIYFGLGLTGIYLLTSFFIMGSAATSWKYQEKKQMKLEEGGEGRRSAAQVLANAGAPAIAAGLSIVFPEYQYVLLLMAAGCFSAAAADTVSSELGNLYGNRFYNIWTLQPDSRGLDGVLSLEGTLFGVAASVLIALVYTGTRGFGNDFFWIVAAGTLGNLSDSILGATLERRNVLNNNAVNFCNTAIAALLILCCKSLA